jgi:hypothetical protein
VTPRNYLFQQHKTKLKLSMAVERLGCILHNEIRYNIHHLDFVFYLHCLCYFKASSRNFWTSKLISSVCDVRFSSHLETGCCCCLFYDVSSF